MECCFCFGSIFSFFLELFLYCSPVAYLAPTDPGSSSFSVLSFCLFILFMGFSRQDYWSGLPFPFPVGHIWWELSTITYLCGFQSVCPLMEKESGLCMLPDGTDWLRGILGLVLMGGAISSKSLIQFYVDGWSWVPSLLFTALGLPRGATPLRSGSCEGPGGPRGATRCWRSGGAAVRRYLSSKVRSSGCALLEKPWRDTPRPR